MIFVEKAAPHPGQAAASAAASATERDVGKLAAKLGSSLTTEGN